MTARTGPPTTETVPHFWLPWVLALAVTSGPKSDPTPPRTGLRPMHAAAPAPAPMPGRADRSESIGTSFGGALRHPVRLRETPDLKLRWSTRARGWWWGTTPLISGLHWVAARMAAPGEAPLVVGNLSRRDGGDLPVSRSHNSGRDVDLGLYTRDRDGTAIASRYYRFEANGRSVEAGGRYVFDVPRNWKLVKTLLLNPRFEVSAMVLSEELEALLLRHADEIGEAPALILRADRLIDRPSWANLHRNHLHVRIACPTGHDRCVEDAAH